MTKIQFLLALNEKLSGLPRNEVEERLNFYSEMIEDRMEEGFSEEEAVAAVGDLNEITLQITEEIPFFKIAREKIRPNRRLKAWEIVLIVAGFPVWFPLILALASVVFALYVVIWAVIVSLWAVFGAVAGSAFGVLAGCIILLCVGDGVPALALLSCGFICTGVSIFLFLGCKAVTGGAAVMTRLLTVSVKRAFAKKEAAQ